MNPHDVLGYPNNWISPTDNGGYQATDLRGRRTQEEFYNLATDIGPGTRQAVELKNKSE